MCKQKLAKCSCIGLALLLLLELWNYHVNKTGISLLKDERQQEKRPQSCKLYQEPQLRPVRETSQEN